MIVNLTNPNGTKLPTKGKLVKEDITIIPNLPGGGGDVDINYELIAFDTGELVLGDVTSPVLGVGMLGCMVLA